MALSLSSRLAIRSSIISWRLFTSDKISYTLFCVWNHENEINKSDCWGKWFHVSKHTLAISVIVLALSISFLWSIFTFLKLKIKHIFKLQNKNCNNISIALHWKWNIFSYHSIDASFNAMIFIVLYFAATDFAFWVKIHEGQM